MWDPLQPWSRGSFNRPVPIPTSAPGDSPLLCLAVNAEWMQYVLGCLKQLMLPATWGDAADPLVQAAQAAANDLIDLFCSALPCGTDSVSGTYAAQCLAAPITAASMTPTEVLSLVVTPGEYHIVARVGMTAGAGPVAALMTLYEDGVNIAQGETIIGSAGWPGTITLDAHVAPSVDTTYTVEISGYNAALTAVPYAPNSTGSVK